MADSEGFGDEMHISFYCEAGEIYWYYKLQYIDNEADRDNNVFDSVGEPQDDSSC